MNNYTIETKVKNGKVILKDLPFKEEVDVNVVLIPKVKFKQLNFSKMKKITKKIKGNLSEDIVAERGK